MEHTNVVRMHEHAEFHRRNYHLRYRYLRYENFHILHPTRNLILLRSFFEHEERIEAGPGLYKILPKYIFQEPQFICKLDEYELIVGAFDTKFEKELGADYQVRLWMIVQLAMKQVNGEEGALYTDGRPNIAFAEDGWVYSATWRNRRWKIDARRAGEKFWQSGTHVFAFNSRLYHH